MNLTKPIPMTREMIEDCLINSKVFRDAVISKLLEPSLDLIHNEVFAAMRKTNGCYNKIAFIKEIREISEGRALDFAKAFPGIVDYRSYDIFPHPKNLGLADSKHIAEAYIKLHSNPHP